MQNRSRLLLMGLCALLAAGAAAAPIRNPPRILQVHEEASVIPPARVGLGEPQMPKFAYATEVNRSKSAFIVSWDAGAGTPPGTLITFEYRQEGSARVIFLHEKLAQAVRGEQRTRFELGTGVQVAAWRVRVVYAGRKLAEQKSDSWK